MSDRFDPRDPLDEVLRRRMERLSAAIPVDPDPRAGTTVRRSAARRRTLRVSLLGATLLVLFSLGATAAIMWIGRPMEGSGAFADGGPLHCSGVDQLSPPAAAAWLAEHGLVAQWQVEDRDAQTSVQQETPPDRGSITEALLLADGHLLILVDLGRDEPLPPKPCT